MSSCMLHSGNIKGSDCRHANAAEVRIAEQSVYDISHVKVMQNVCSFTVHGRSIQRRLIQAEMHSSLATHLTLSAKFALLGHACCHTCF